MSISSTFAVNLLNGANFWIRWVDTDDSGNDHALAIDDFSMSTPGSLAIDDVSQAEGNLGTTNFTFTVTRTGGSMGAVGATWTLTLSGAANAADFTAFPQTGTVNWADGVTTSQTITITVQGDLGYEASELFTVVLSNATGGVSLADSSGQGTITNDDAPVPPAVDLDTGAGAVGIDALVDVIEGDETEIGYGIQVTQGTFPITGAVINIDDGIADDVLSISGALPATILIDPSSTATHMILTGTGSAADWANALSCVRYSNSTENPDVYGSDHFRSISVTVSDPSSTSATAVATVTVVAVDDAPVVLNLDGDSVSWTEGDGYVLLDQAAGVTISDVDNLNFAGGELSVGVQVNPKAEDEFFIVVDGNVTVSGSNVSVGGFLVGSITSSGPGNLLTISLNSASTPGRIETLLQHIAYRNVGGDAVTTGDRSVVYFLRDGPAAFASAVASGVLDLHVTGTQDDPTGADKTITIVEDNSYVLTFADFGYSDPDGDAMSGLYIVSGVITGGTLTLNGTQLNGNSDFVTKAQIDAGELVFTPTPDGFGTAYGGFSFQVRDSAGNLDQNYRSITFDITGTPDPTQITGTDTGSVSEDGGTAMGTLLAYDPDGMSGFAAADVTGAYGDFVLGTDGQWSYTVHNAAPEVQELGAGEQVLDVFHIQAADGTTHDVTITVNGSNDDPTGSDNTVTTDEDTPYVLTFADFGYADVDGDDMSGLYIVTGIITGGTLTLNGTPLNGNSNLVTKGQIDAGLLVFVPTADGNGAGLGSFSFQVADGNGGLDQTYRTMTIDVNAVNDAPVVDQGIADAHSAEDAPVSYTFAADAFSDPEGDTLTYTAFLADGSDSPLPGWLSFDSGTRTFSGTPPQDDYGTISIRVYATDPGGLSTSTDFDLVIDPVNDAPELDLDFFEPGVDAAATFAIGRGPVTLTPFAIFDDDNTSFDGATLTVSLTANGTAGDQLRINNIGTGLGEIGVSGNTISYEGVNVATFTGGIDGTDLVITFNAAACHCAIETVMENVNFRVTGPTPDFDPRTISFTLVDGGGGDDTGTADVIVEVVAPPHIHISAPASTAIGDETLVNTTTAGDQGGPAAAVLGDGTYVVAWQGSDGIYFQQYDYDGTPLYGETKLDDGSAIQFDPDVVALADGGFALVYVADDGVNPGAVWLQRYDSCGCEIGDAIQVGASADNRNPQATLLAGGEIVVTWQSNVGNNDIHARVLDATGAPLTAEFTVNSFTADEQTRPDVAALADGGFRIVWTSAGQEAGGTGGLGIYSQRYDSQGAPVGGEVHLNTSITGPQQQVVVAGLDGLGEVMVWQDAGDIVQRFRNPVTGSLGAEEIVSAFPGAESNPQVSRIDDGGYVISWTVAGQDGDAGGIYAQRYDAAGSRVGGIVLVNSTTAGNQTGPAVTRLDDGYLVTWTSSGQDGDLGGVYSQRYADAFLATEQVALDLKGRIHVSDLDTTGDVTVTLLVAFGTLQVDAGTSGVDVNVLFPGVVELTGTIAEIEDLLNTNGSSIVTYIYDGDDTPPADTLAVQIDDGTCGCLGIGADFDTALILLTAVNDAPVNTVPASPIAVTEDVAQAITGLAVADADIGAGVITVTLSVLHGTLWVRDDVSGGVGPLEITGNGTATVTLQCDPDDVNATLAAVNGVVYTPDANYNGGDTLTMTSNDGGNTGTPGPLQDIDAVTITIAAVNDIPTVTPVDVLADFQSGNVEFSVANFGFSDVDGDTLAIIDFQSISPGTTFLWDNDGNPNTPLVTVPAHFVVSGDPLFFVHLGTGQNFSTIIFTVRDSGGAESAVSAFHVTRESGSSAPPVLNTPIPDQVRNEDNLFVYQVPAGTFTDPDSTLTYSATLANGSPLPSWLSFNAATQLFSGQLPQDFSGTISLRVIASDGTSQAFDDFDLNVMGIADGANIRLDAGGPYRTVGSFTGPFGGLEDPRVDLVNADETYPRAAATDDGGWVMVWSQSNGNPNILAQRFDANGDRNEAVIFITDAGGASEGQPDVTSLAGGGFAVAFVSNGGGEITVRIYGPTGINPTSTIVLPDTGAEQTPTITRLSDGSLLVTWEVPGGSTTISGIRLDASGALLDASPQTIRTGADNFHANDNPTPHAVTALAGGAFAITWVEGGNVKVMVETLGATWTAGPIVTLDEGALNDRSPTVTTLSDGRFLVVWEASDGGPSDLWGQFFSAAGVADGGHVLLTGGIPSSEFEPNVSALAGGGFALTWLGNNGLNSTLDVRLQTFDATGNAVGAVLPVTTTGFTSNPGAAAINEGDATLTTLADGRIVLSWVDPDPDTVDPRATGDDLRYQLFDPGGAPELREPIGVASFELPMDISLFDASESLDVVIIQGVSDYGWSLAVGHYDAFFDYDPGNFLDAAWVIVRGYSAEEDAFLDALLAGTAEVEILTGGFAPAAQFFLGITAITSDGASTRQAITRDLVVEFANTPPTAVDDTLAATEDTPVTYAAADLVGNDDDGGDGGPLVITAVSNFTGGTAVLNGDGTVTFTPSPNFTGVAGFDYVVSDGSATDTGHATVNVSAVNDAPVITAPATAATDEDTSFILSGISVADPDIGTNDYLVTLSVSHGTLTLVNFGNFSLGSSGSFAVTAANVAALLNGIRYTPDANYNGPDALTITISDQGATGSGGALSDTEVINITVNAVNDPVSGNAPATLVLNEDSSAPIAGLSISDVDAVLAPGGIYFVQLSATHGTLTLTTLTGLTFFNGDGTADATMVFNGTLANINAALATASYAGNPDFFGPAQITMTVNDQYGGIVATGSGPATSDTDIISVTVNPVNDAPVNSVGGPVTVNEDTAIALTGITISDVDSAPSETFTVLLTVQHGMLTIRTDVAGGITAANIVNGGNGTNGLTITATMQQINATLIAANGLIYQGDLNFNGNDSLRVSTWEGVPADAASFAAPLVSSALTNATSLVTGDVNGDGKLDLVYIGAGAAQIGVRLGNGDGTFGATTALAAGANPSEVILADVDGDNDLDIVSTDYASGASSLGSVGVLLNNGNGTFGAYQALAPLQSPYDVVTGDVNGDGRLDIIVDRRDYGLVSVLLASGAPGSFAAPVTYNASTPNYTTGITLGDFNNDGRLDVVAFNQGLKAGGGIGTVSLLLNNGNGTFAAPVDIFASGTVQPYEGTTYDLNNDGNLDLVFANYTLTDGVTVMLGNGNGTFAAPAFYATAGDADQVVVGDVNGDGIADIVTSNGASGSIAVFLGNGNGSFQSRVDLAISSAYAETPVLGDFNGDGRVDIAVNGATNTGQRVLLNLGTYLGDTDARAITVNPVNDAPAGTNGSATFNEDTSYTFSAADFGFTDPNDSPANSFLSVFITTLPGNGTLTLGGNAVTAGQEILVGQIGTLVFTPAANANGMGYASFTFQVRDDGGTANGGVDIDQSPNTFILNVSPVNDAPAIDLNGAGAGTSSFPTYTENAANAVLAPAATVVDIDSVDFDTGTLTVTITAGATANDSLFAINQGNGAGQTGVSGATISFGGTAIGTFTGGAGATPLVVTFNANASLAAVQALLRDIGFAVNSENPTGGRTVQFSLTDGDGGTSNSASAIVSIQGVNDAPSGADKTVTVNEDTSYVFARSDFGFSDPAEGHAFIAVIISTLPASGTLLFDSDGAGGNDPVAVAPGAFILTSDIDAGKLTFQPAPNANGVGYASFTFQVFDSGGTSNGGQDTDQSPNTITVDVTPVNDAPTNSVPGAQSTNEDTSKVFSIGNGNQISVSDIDVGGGNLTVTLTVAHGTLTLSGVAGLSFGAGANGSATMTITGTAAAINTALKGLTYAPAANYNGPDTLQIQTSDNGNTGTGGALTDSDSVAITVNSVNDAPAGTDKSVTINEDSSYTFASADFGFSDVNDSPANTLLAVKFTTLPSSGTLFYDADGAGGAAPVAVSVGQSILASEIALGKVTFVPNANANGNPLSSFTFQVQDNGGTANGGVDLDQSPNTFTLNVTAVNDAPVNTVPGAQSTNEDTAKVFSTGNGNAISVSDLDASTLTVTLTVSHGTLTLSGTAGLTFNAGANGSATMTITGTAAAINTALDGLTYAPTSNYNGPDAIQIQTSDNGQTGTGGTLTDSDSVSINVVSVNDAPAGTNNTLTGSEDDPVVFTAADFGFTDANDSPANSLLAVRIASLPAVGTLFLDPDGVAGGAPGVAVSVGQFISLADINAGHLYFLGAPDGFGSPYASFTFQVQDNGGTANGGVDLDQSPNTLTINLTPDNLPPAVDLDGGGAGINYATTFVEDGVAVAIGAGIVVSDPDSGIGDLIESAKVTLTDRVTGDSLTFSTPLPGGFTAIVTSNAGSITIDITGTGTAAQYQSILQSIVYATTNQDPTAGGADPARTITVTVNDGMVDSAVATTTIFIIPVDDAPVAQPDAFTITESQLLSGNLFADHGSGADVDPDGPAFAISAVNGSAANVGTQIVLASGALLTVNANGTFNYNPNGVFDPTPTPGSGASNAPAHDSFTYTVAGGNTATVTITLTGLDTDDLLLGTAGADLLVAGVGNDTMIGGNGDDSLDGGAGIDTAVFTASDLGYASSAIGWVVTSTEGNDVLQRTEIVVDGAGQRNLLVGSTAFAGIQAAFDAALAGDFVRLANGTYPGTFNYNVAGLTVIAQPGAVLNATFTTAGTDGITVVAAGGADTITTGAGNDVLFGGAGVDHLNGGGGNDQLTGGTGADVMAGGAGDDFYFIDNGGDQVIDAVGQGTGDRVFASVSYTLAAGAEIEVLSTDFNAGTTAINLTGNGFANALIGNDGDNFLDGAAGADLLIGRAGNDFYFIDNGGDQVIDAVGQGSDRVFASVSYTLTAGAEVEVLSTDFHAGTTAINLTGNELANYLLGNDGDNFLDGAAGADLLIGRSGNDFYFIDNAGDQVVETAGQGSDRVFAGASYTLAAGVDVEVMSTDFNAGTNAINLTGNELSQVIFGNNGANIIDGGAGADTLVGNAGNDTFAFTSALGGGNVDNIADFQGGGDKIGLDDAVFTQIGGLGALNPNAFFAGTAAHDADDRIIYDQATGNLFYDADGNGAGAAVLFANLGGAPTITANDFVVI